MNPTIMATAKPGGVEMDLPVANEENHGLMAAAADLLSAIEAKDASLVAQALESAFLMLDQPSDESLDG